MAINPQIRPYPSWLDSSMPKFAWDEWPAHKRLMYAVGGGAAVGTIAGAVSCFHFDLPVVRQGETYMSMFTRTFRMVSRAALAVAAGAGGYQAVKDYTDGFVGRKSAWGTMNGGLVGGLLLSSILGKPGKGLFWGLFFGASATFVDHFGGFVPNEQHLTARDKLAWDTNNKFRVLLSEEKKAERQALLQKEMEVLGKL